MKLFPYVILLGSILGCTETRTKLESQPSDKQIPKPEYSLSNEQTHNKFSRKIAPVLSVPDGAIIEFNTEEATLVA